MWRPTGEAEMGWGVLESDGEDAAPQGLPEVPPVDGRSLIQQAEDWHNYCRAEFGERSMRTLSAFHAIGRAYVASGRRIDELYHYIPDEWQRFQSRLIQGADGHVFWDGKDEFVLNGDKHHNPKRRPVYYWWVRLYGSHPFRLVTCATKGCVSPYHAHKEDRRETRERIFPDHVILGSLQVWALQHGRSPRKKEWEELKLTPSTTTIHKRFGSFDQALGAAGLAIPRLNNKPTNAAKILEGIHAVACELGEWPKYEQYRLASVGRHAAPVTVRAYFGTWGAAREAAMALYPELV